MLDDFGSELEEIRREIVESRSLSIKTNNLVNALSADVNSIAKRQQNYESRLRWNSAVAYVVTVVVLMVVAKIVVDARIEAVRAQTQDQLAKVTRLEKEISQLRGTEEHVLKDERAASDFYDLVLKKDHRAILGGYEAIAKLKLTRTEQKLFEAARDFAQSELSVSLYNDGLDHVRTGRWHEAEQAFSQSLQFKSDASHSASARFHQARALTTLGKAKDAVPILLRLSESSPDKELLDAATLLLAQAQIDLEAYNDAKGTLRNFIRRFPGSPLLNDARMKLADIQLHH
jgi:TolA-binding protein